MPGQLRNPSSGREHHGTGNGGHARTCPQTDPHPGCDVSNLQQKGQHHPGRSCRRMSGTWMLQLRRPQVTPVTRDTLSMIRPHTPNEPTSPRRCDTPGRTAQPLGARTAGCWWSPRRLALRVAGLGLRDGLGPVRNSQRCLWVGRVFGVHHIPERGNARAASCQQSESPRTRRWLLRSGHVGSVMRV